MTRDAEYELRSFLELLMVLGIAAHIRPVVRKSTSVGVRLTWPGEFVLQRGRTIDADDYFGILEHQSYSALLTDGSVLQISFDYEGSALVGHRLAMIPCPYDVDSELVMEFGLFDALQLIRTDPHTKILLRGPIRFDFDPNAASDLHPASHLTIINNESRIPITRPITLGHFIRFVFRHFFPHLHRTYDALAQWKLSEGAPIAEPMEPTELHLHWRSPSTGAPEP